VSTLLCYTIFFIWSTVDLFCIYYIMRAFKGLKRRKAPVYKFVLILIYYAITATYAYECVKCNSVLIALLYLPYNLKAFLIMASLYRKRNYWTIIGYIIIFEAIISITVQTIMYTLKLGKSASEVTGFQIENLLYILIGGIIMFTLFLLDKQVIGKNLRDYTSIIPLRIYVIIVPSLFCVGLLESELFEGDISIKFNQHLARILCVLLVVLLITLIIHLLVINKSMVFSEKITEILSQQVESLVSQYEEINRRDEELRRFKHDNKNMLLCLQAMMEANDTEQAVDYIKNMKDSLQIAEGRYDCGNYIIDALMNSKNYKASKCNTTLEFDGFVPTGRITNFDLCVIFANALDNAMEACEVLPGDKCINITSNISNGFWFLIIDNPVGANVDIYKNSIETNKKNKELHGYGLMNIEQVIKKYNGELTLTCENYFFTFEAALQLRNEKTKN
jgi:two-component system, LytTR family, sensor histidine kinase AgrC